MSPSQASLASVESIPVPAFLAGYPAPIRAQADVLRDVVRRAVPRAGERVRPGWRLIGYDVPVAGRKPAYFAYVAPEPEHVHLGFEYGILLDDPERLLEGAHLNLRQVRYLTYRPGDAIPGDALVGFTRAAAAVAALSRGERFARLLDRDEA